MVARQPRPALSVLVAGRFRVSRPALLARPAGPVAAADGASGTPVRLVAAPRGVDPAELQRRVESANALGRPDCPTVGIAEDESTTWLAVRLPDGAVALDGAAA